VSAGASLVALALGLPFMVAIVLSLLDGRRPWVGWIAVATIAATLAAAIALTAVVIDDGAVTVVPGGWPEGIGITLRADALGLLFVVTSLTVAGAATAYQVAQGVETRTFPALVLFLATGLTGLFLTGDVFNFFVFFELSMISGYVLTGYGGRAREIRGAFVFAVINLLGSFIFLIGVAAIYHVTGTLDMQQVAERMAAVEPGVALPIAVTLFVAFGVKLGLFPFHFWLPVVYTASRPAVVAILAGGLANIGSYGLLRFGAGIMPREVAFSGTALLVLGALTIVYGGMQAISCRSTSEVLAYSAIGQVGYVLIGLGVGGTLGLAAAVIYAVVNALNKLLLFLSVGVRGWLVGAAFCVGAFSVAGIPPSAGFFSKLAVFQAGVAVDSAALVTLVFLGGALSFIYMFQAFQRDHWAAGPDAVAGSSRGERGLVLGLAALVVAVGVWPEPLLMMGSEAASALTGGAP
jgi:multicomponent Na+:H+ antiporter subunit D